MHHKGPALVVMAAGLGSRFGGLKQVAEVGPHGESILDYCLFDAERAGFGRVVFIIREGIQDQFRERIGDRWSDRMPVEYAFQELHMLPSPHVPPEGREKPWGTGHALLQVRTMIDGPFAVINADDLYGQEAFEILGRYLSTSDGQATDHALVGFELPKTLSPHGAVSRGICATTPEGWLETITETHGVERTADGGAQRSLPSGGTEAIDGSALTSMNMWGFHPSILEQLNDDFPDFLETHAGDLRAEFLIPEVVKGLLASGSARVRVLPTTSPCIGVTHREDTAIVQAHVRALVDDGAYPPALFP